MPTKQQRPIVKDEPPLQRQRIEGGPESDAASAAELNPFVHAQGVGALQAAQHLIEAEMRAKDAEITRLQAEVARLNSENAHLRLQPASFGHVDLEQLHERLAGMEQRITSALQQRLFDHAALLHADPPSSSVQGAAAACPRPRAPAAPPQQPAPFSEAGSLTRDGGAAARLRTAPIPSSSFYFQSNTQTLVPVAAAIVAAAPPAPVPVAAALVAAAAHSISSSVLLRRVDDSSKAQKFTILLDARLVSRRSYRLLYTWSRRRGGGSAAAFHEHCDGQVRVVLCFSSSV